MYYLSGVQGIDLASVLVASKLTIIVVINCELAILSLMTFCIASASVRVRISRSTGFNLRASAEPHGGFTRRVWANVRAVCLFHSLSALRGAGPFPQSAALRQRLTSGASRARRNGRHYGEEPLQGPAAPLPLPRRTPTCFLPGVVSFSGSALA